MDSFADLLRCWNLIGGTLVIAIFPMTVWRQGRHWSAWLAVAGSELLFLAVILRSIAVLGQPMNPSVPLISVAAVLYLAYCGLVWAGSSGTRSLPAINRRP